jgi:hypothetical protein
MQRKKEKESREEILIMTSPSGDWSILSIPLGPSEVRRMRATARPAAILAFCASSPRSLVLFSCSLSIINGLPYSSNASAILVSLFLCLPGQSVNERERDGEMEVERFLDWNETKERGGFFCE